MTTSLLLFVEVVISVPAAPLGNLFLSSGRSKRKGLQLALEPLNGRGIAGYVPEPKLRTRPARIASREELHML
jgi:hypothetical protein